MNSEPATTNPLFKMAVAAVLPLGLALPASQDAQADPRESSAPIVARLKAEAVKITKSELSPLFTAFSSTDANLDLRLSPQQTDLARRLAGVLREIIRAWLLRGLETDAQPVPAVLAERVSERGNRLRASLIAHAEAIAIQGILTPEQAATLRKAGGRGPERLLHGREGPQPRTTVEHELTVTELAEALKGRGRGFARAGEVLEAALGQEGVEEAYPNGVEGLDRVRQLLASRYLPKVDLPRRQAELARQLDRVTVAIFRAWLISDLDRKPLPALPVLAERLAISNQLEDSLYVHAEAISVQGILTQDQVDRCLAYIWRRKGVRALRDPALASRLGLSRLQRENVLDLIENRDRIQSDLWSWLGTSSGILYFRPDLEGEMEQRRVEANNNTKFVESMIWDVLTPAQSRALARILRQPAKPAVNRSDGVKKPAQRE